jgi:dihydroorotate dehydrogenase (fumarate)
MIDLRTSYLGFSLQNPIVASASPLSESEERIRQLEDAGVAAVVLPSLFEEQIELESTALDSDLSRGAESFGESLSYFPDLTSYNLGPESYLELIHAATTAVDVPVIASLNGSTRGGWTRYARLMEEAGASALELNLYWLATSLEETAAQVEARYAELVHEVRESVGIPVAVKLSHFFTAFPNAARRLDAAGANALVLFNRFYQPDLDLESLEVVPSLALSHSYELLLRLHWVGIVYGHVKADLAVTGGVHTSEDVLKSMMVGARVAMMTSALLRNGLGHVRQVLDGVRRWMEDHEYESIRQMQGSMSRRSVGNSSAYDRGNYMKVLSSYILR